MIKTTTYTGDGICSLCGANKPTQQIQYTSATRKASVPICDKCFKELKPCEGCKPKKNKNKKSAGQPIETTHTNTSDSFGKSAVGTPTFKVGKIVISNEEGGIHELSLSNEMREATND